MIPPVGSLGHACQTSKLISSLGQLLPLTAIKTYTEKTTGKGPAKRESVTFFCNGRFPFASPTFTRTDMVKLIYAEFGIETEYVVGVENGPVFKTWFTRME